jgi:hypothetical protein
MLGGKEGGSLKGSRREKSLLAIEVWHATDWITWRLTQSVGGGSASSNLQLYISNPHAKTKITPKNNHKQL